MAKEVGYKYARQDLRTLLEERNKQVIHKITLTYLLICIQNAFLREQLVVRIEHAAHLETRLLCTLDTLDELQASSTHELQQAQRDNTHLTEKLRAWEAVARQADAEKSDMSSAVLQLVAKVESCNDYSKWQAPRIEFSHDITLQPMRSARTSQGAPSAKKHEECTCAQAYSPAVVEELSDSLAREKRTHALTIEEAERRTAALQSRIAIRDAEIAHRAATCRCLPIPSSVDTSAHLELMSEEEQARIATRTAERSCSLASEVATLEDKVRQERRLHRTETLPRVHRCVQTEPQGSSCTYISPVKPLSGPVPPHTSDNEYDPVPDALNTLDSQINHLRKRLTDLVMEKESLQYVLRDELGLRDPRLLLSPRKQDRVEDYESVDISTDQDADKFDAPTEKGCRGGDDFTGILLLEEECIRLMRSEGNLRSSLEQLKQRNALLNEENTRLKEEISRLRSGETRPAEHLSPLSLPPLDTSAIDLSFPPLQPDAISPTYANVNQREEAPVPTSSGSSASSSSSPLTPTSAIEPSEVPLPRTPTFDDPETELSIQYDDDAPDELREPELPAHPSSSSPRRPQEQLHSPPDANDRPPDQRDVHVVERELAGARADAEDREREMSEVRDMMADLALRIGSELQGS
ncbi:hypothetical protein ACEPAF_9608 [Sanghuangporus sanghuang]